LPYLLTALSTCNNTVTHLEKELSIFSRYFCISQKHSRKSHLCILTRELLFRDTVSDCIASRQYFHCLDFCAEGYCLGLDDHYLGLLPLLRHSCLETTTVRDTDDWRDSSISWHYQLEICSDCATVLKSHSGGSRQWQHGGIIPPLSISIYFVQKTITIQVATF